MLEVIYFFLAWLAAVMGMSWFALAIDANWRDVIGAERFGFATKSQSLRGFGFGGVALSLLLCVRADHVTMAVLVWVLMLAVAALCVTGMLTWRRHWLSLCVLRAPQLPGNGYRQL